MDNGVLSILLVSIALTAGCGGTKEWKKTAVTRTYGKAGQEIAALATVIDQDAFMRQLQIIKNPHIEVAGQYLTDEINRIGTDKARPPEGNNLPRIKAYPLMAALWRNPNIETCWENPSAEFQSQMQLVQKSIAATWAAASKLRFSGWARCPETSPSTQQVIRIQVADTDPNNGPRTLGLGMQLAGVQHGMLLNFSFLHWSPNCRAMVDYCVRAIAVHEFGHAIALAHEQNRPDKPGECMDTPQGMNGDNTQLTPYDPESVMNYCNSKYNNDGILSRLDTDAVVKLYGAP